MLQYNQNGRNGAGRTGQRPGAEGSRSQAAEYQQGKGENDHEELEKRALSGLSCAALLTGLLGTGAFAAEAGTASAIGVELNGQAMTFTDAVPEADQGRTFLPFRAVFEALGAEVGYDNATKTCLRPGAIPR